MSGALGWIGQIGPVKPKMPADSIILLPEPPPRDETPTIAMERGRSMAPIGVWILSFMGGPAVPLGSVRHAIGRDCHSGRSEAESRNPENLGGRAGFRVRAARAPE